MRSRRLEVLRRVALGASLAGLTGGALTGCQPGEKIILVHAPDGPGARRVFSVAFSQRITVPDNFVLRPDEFAAVTVDHGRGLIYAGSREGTLLALDHGSGKVVWEQDMGGAVSGRPTIADLPGDDPRPKSVLLVGTDNGELVSIDLDTHEVRWRYQTAGKVRNEPVVHEGVVYFVNSRDQIYALDIRTGEWRWQYEQELQTDFTVHGHAGLVLVPAADPTAGETATLYTGFDNGKVVALGAGSGEALWIASVAPPEGGDFIDCDSTPLVDPQRGELYVAGMQTGIFALSLEDGSVRWQHPVRGVGTVVESPAGDLIAGSSLEGMLSLDRQGNLLWRTQLDPGVVSTPIVVGGTVFATHSDAGLLAFDVATGQYLARIDLGSGMSSVPVYDPHDGRFYATTNRGLLLALDIDSRVQG